jgi:hypothetical protein
MQTASKTMSVPGRRQLMLSLLVPPHDGRETQGTSSDAVGIRAKAAPLPAEPAETERAPKDVTKCVQQYSPDDLDAPVAVHDSIADSIRPIDGQRGCITKAHADRTLYKGYRWNVVDRANRDVYGGIGATRAARLSRSHGTVAQLHATEERIVALHRDKNAAGAAVGRSGDTIAIGVNTKTLRAGFRWVMYADCSQELRATAALDPDQLYKPNSSKRIQQIDYMTGEVVRTFSNMSDACREFQMCHKKLKDMSECDAIYNGFLWKIV